MLRRVLAVFLLVNVVAIVPNLPRILAALDGEAIGDSVGRWSIGVSTAGGDLVEDISRGAPGVSEVPRLQEELRSDPLDDPFDDESLADLAELWRLVQRSGESVDPADLAELLGDPEAQDADPAE